MTFGKQKLNFCRKKLIIYALFVLNIDIKYVKMRLLRSK